VIESIGTDRPSMSDPDRPGGRSSTGPHWRPARATCTGADWAPSRPALAPTRHPPDLHWRRLGTLPTCTGADWAPSRPALAPTRELQPGSSPNGC